MRSMETIMSDALEQGNKALDPVDLLFRSDWPQTNPEHIDQEPKTLQAVGKGKPFTRTDHAIEQGDHDVGISGQHQVEVGVIYDASDDSVSFLNAEALKRTHQEAPTIPLEQLVKHTKTEVQKGPSLQTVRKHGSSRKHTPVSYRPTLKGK